MSIDQIAWRSGSALHIQTAELSCIVCTDFGPRIAELRLKGGDSLLYWAEDPEQRIREQPPKGAFHLRGGHRFWLTRPGADENEDTYAPDDAPCTVAISGDCVRISAALCPYTQTRKHLILTILADDTLRVDHECENCGPMLFSAGAWGLTCTSPSADCRYIIPLGDTSGWQTATIVHFAHWAGGLGQKGYADEQFTVTEDALLITPQGRQNKRMVQSAAGLIALSDRARSCTFGIGIAEAFSLDAAYPHGTNIAAFIGADNFMVEMETMGPARCLKPAAAPLLHSEIWRLRAGAIDCSGAAARAFMA